MRNLLVHRYFGVDLEEVWKTVEKDLPDLKQKIEALVRKPGNRGVESKLRLQVSRFTSKGSEVRILFRPPDAQSLGRSSFPLLEYLLISPVSGESGTHHESQKKNPLETLP